MSTPRKAKRRRTERSIWNTADDWDTLVAESQLSTSSISSRPALSSASGLKSLRSCCAHVAGRSFKRFWELDNGLSWKLVWKELPDPHKVEVRDEVFRSWGGYLTTNMISELFIFPPFVNLPGGLLPSVASAERLIPFRPSTHEGYTRLSLKHAPKASDTAIAGLIHAMPLLEDINLKGCTLAGKRTIEIICKKCKGLRRLNLKGTNVNEQELREVLDLYGKQLEVLKLDRVIIESPDETFIHDSYPTIKKLCLPGDILQPGTADFRRRSAQSGHTIPWPVPRPPSADSRMTWEAFGSFFPSLTHLSLPGLLLPPDTRLRLQGSNQLVKLDLGAGGPPVPVAALSDLIMDNRESLQHLTFGHVLPAETGKSDWPSMQSLIHAIDKCTKLHTIDIQVDPAGSKNYACDAAMARWSPLIYRQTMVTDLTVKEPVSHLKRLTLRLNGELGDGDTYDDWFGEHLQAVQLEELRIPSAQVAQPSALAQHLASCSTLRILDVSSVRFSDDDIFTILDGCPLLHMIDLTSCRGIRVQNRRNVFKAWEESRAPTPPPSPERLGRGGRKRAKR